MRNPFHPPSLYQNYQPPPQRSDFYMPVPGWGWPVDSAGPRRVGVGALGETYNVNLPIYGATTMDIPVSQMAADAANAAVPVIRDAMPGIVEQASATIRMTVVQGALLAAAIGAMAIFGYKYATGK